MVLIVDDDPDLGTTLKEIFEDLTNAEVELIMDGRRALARLEAAPPDLTVLDLHLPHVSGLELLRHMRASDTWREARVVMISADTLQIKQAAGLADALLVKPVDIDDLLALAQPSD